MKRVLRPLALFSLFAVPSAVLAAVPPSMYIYCGGISGISRGLPGCPGPWKEYFSSTLLLLLAKLPVYVVGLATLFIMIGGSYMIINAGDSEKVTKGKNTIIWSIIGLFVTQFAANFVYYSPGGGTPGFIPLEVINRVPENQDIDLVISVIMTLIGSILTLSQVVILGYAIFSGMRMVVSAGKEEEFNKGKEGLVWSAVGAIIINLAAAIVNAFSTL